MSKLTRFRVFPMDLFRICQAKKVTLREFEAQKKKGSRSFDYILNEDKLIHASVGDTFVRPNGLSLRPRGINMWDILSTWAGRGKTNVLVIPQGTIIPDDLVLIHEHGDHYSLQTTISRTPRDLNSSLTKFMDPFEMMTKEEYFERYPLTEQ